MKKIIIGIGNEFWGNDAIGIIIAQRLNEILPEYDLKTGAFRGIDFLEVIDGYNEVIVIDSLINHYQPIGSVVELKTEDFTDLKNFSYWHSMNLATAIEIGQQLNLKLPEKIKIFGIVVEKKGTLGENLSVEINEKLDCIIETIKLKI